MIHTPRSLAALFLIGLGACSSGADGGPALAPGNAPTGNDAPSGTGPTADAGANVDASKAEEDAGGNAKPSRCKVDASGITCAHDVTTVEGRTVAYASPLGVAPAAGWPTVLYFQGSYVAGHTAFTAVPGAKFGLYELTRTIQALLDRGYAVIGPDAKNGSVWETNIPPSSVSWSGCSDDLFMQSLFTAMASGKLGPVNSARLYAMGISSGGFMTSRMAVSYPGKFRALADHSGSYATCSTLCFVPTPLPSDHAPILFLQGAKDLLVPTTSVKPYLDALLAEGHTAKLVTDPDAGHEWLAAGATEIPAWFDAHP